MATVDPAGSASAALYTPAVKIPTPTQAVNITERAVLESTEAEPSNDAVTQASNGASKLGSIIDTTA